MRNLLFSTAFILLLLPVTACHSAPKPAFVVSNLRPGDSDIHGCNMVLIRADGVSHAPVFIENAGLKDAYGYIRIDDRLIKVTLLTTASDGVHGLRSFGDTANTLSVIAAYDFGKKHPENGSTALIGNLTVTYKNVTQILPVGGGTAC
eukprot:gene30525-39334_t